MPRNDDLHPVFLPDDTGDVTEIDEFPTHGAPGGSGGGGFGGELPIDTGGGGGGPGGGGAGPGGITPIVTSPAEPGEEDIEARLQRGEATPAEALAYFQHHRFPWLSSLPVFDGDNGWVFFEPLQPTDDGAIPPTVKIQFAPPEAAVSPQAPDGGSTAGPSVPGDAGSGSGGGGGGGIGETGAGPSTPEPPSPSPQPPVPPPLPSPPGPDAGGPTLSPLGANPFLDNDGKPLDVPAVHVAQQQLDGALRDLMDASTPRIAHFALTSLLPATFVASLLEGHILNPLLAVPSKMYEGALRTQRAGLMLEAGQVANAVVETDAAEAAFRDAGMAVLAVVPLGELGGTVAAGERLAERGVTLKKFRRLSSVEDAVNVIHQLWVTQQPFEWEFVLQMADGAKVTVEVDGFINLTGVDHITRLADMMLVEAKMDTAVERVMRQIGREASFADLARADGFAGRALDQLARYMELARRMEVAGVRYVITESVEGAPMTAWWARLIREGHPEWFENGLLDIVSTPYPPVGWIP
jgi:hypothetical protein